jgi:hypothetical protein
MNRGVLFSFFLVSTLVTYYLGRKNKQWNLLLLIPFAVLAIRFLMENSNYKTGSIQSSNAIQQQLEKLNTSDTKFILTDTDLAESYTIYNGFKTYDHLKMYSFSKYDSLYSNGSLYALVNTEETTIPDFIKQNSNAWEIIFDEKGLLVYKKMDSTPYHH